MEARVLAEGDELSGVHLARFLRDVTEATTKQQSTVEAQTTDGFVTWLDVAATLPGVRSAYVERPDDPPTTILEVLRPGPAPTPPRTRTLGEGEELSAEERAATETYRREQQVWEQHKDLYDGLFGARTPPESLELVFATGFLVTHGERETLRRHLVTAPAEVELDRSSQALRVTLVDSARVELNWTDPSTRTTLGDAAGPLRDLQDSQCASEAWDAVEAIRASFGLSGVPLTEPGERVPGEQTGIGALPALLLRKRDSSFLLQLLRDMVDDMESGGLVSDPFRMIISPTYEPAPQEVLADRAALPLPANEEQRVMIDNARREPHLVIQGPPGTGKTHTIANLAAVLMAEGRRVLVTAENERALGEVQTKLPSDMRPLMLPMLKERGTGPLQASVNELSSRASRTSTPEVRERKDREARERVEELEQAIRDAEAALTAVATRDQVERTFGSLTMPLAGHLVHLGDRADQLELVDRYLSEDGSLRSADADDLLRLSGAVTESHRTLASHRFPEAMMEPSDLAMWLQEHRSELAVLGDPGDFDHSVLADSVDDLVRLASMLQELPSTPWSAISRTPEEYGEAAETAAAVASDIDHSVTIDDTHRQSEAIALCEEYLALDAERFDEPIAQLVERQQRAAAHAASALVLGEFARFDRAEELSRACEEALELLRRDRSGLLARHVGDHRTQGHSSVDQLVSEAQGLIEGTRDAVGLPVTVEDGAPANHELARQAEQLHEHLAGGGKMSGFVRTPKAVKEAAELIRYVQVGASPIDTVEEAERAAGYFRFRTQLGLVDAWAQSHDLIRPEGTPHHDWLVAITGLPAASEQVREACKRAEELVSFGFGSAPEDPEAFLVAALATISREVADTLAGLATAADAAPTVALAGLPVRSRADAERALAALAADRRRRSLHAMLPDSWAERCNPVDVDDGDLLTEMLTVAAAAAKVPGRARTADLVPSAVNRIAERAQVDQRRADLRAEHDRVIGGLQRKLTACVPQSPATQALGAALTTEDPIAYRQALEALHSEIEHAEQALRLDAVRAAAETAHPRLLHGFDAGEDGAQQVLADISVFEQLRDHRHATRRWKHEVGSAEHIHDRLRMLHHEARRAEQRLASLRAWDSAVERLQARRDLKSALSALTNAMDAVPKTRTAKSYPARMRALQTATRAAAPAIPCWVMTIDRVAEVLGYPTGGDRFDVVIIDEASQAWFPAMFLYAIADQVIVVGDKLQTSPSQVVSTDQLASIAREHIFGHRLEDRIGDDLSLYDIAEVMTGPDMMVDHFRCVPEIIDISNRLSYGPMGRQLQPSRVREPGALQPVNHVRVHANRVGQQANEIEIEEIVNRVVTCHSDPAYEGMDFGVVVVGPSPNAHLKHLRTRLLDVLGPQAMRDRNLEVGTASQFQGAERNVMFLSLIVGPTQGERIRAWPHEHTGRNRRNVQQLNVAVSRARDQLWIFHSFDRTQLAPNDARAILLEQPKVETVSLDEQLAACQSQFERDVVQAIVDRDQTLTVTTQVEALGYAIDVVVEDGHGHRLAVECDGDRWHSSSEQIRSDLYRQRTLENIGWRFHRFLASEWYDDPSAHLDAILDELSHTHVPAGRGAAPHDDELVDFDAGDEDDEAWDLDENLEDWDRHEQDELEELDAGDRAEVPKPSDSNSPRAQSSLFISPGRDGAPTAAAASDTHETLTCTSCGSDWTREIRRGRKPSLCPDCKGSSAGSTRSAVRSIKERNRALAAALRDAGKEPTGDTWARAKDMVEKGATFDEAAARA